MKKQKIVKTFLLTAVIVTLLLSTAISARPGETGQKPFKGWASYDTNNMQPFTWDDLAPDVANCLAELILSDENSAILPPGDGPGGLPESLQILWGHGNNNIGGRTEHEVIGLAFFAFPTLYLWEYETWTTANGDRIFTKNIVTLNVLSMTLAGEKIVVGGTGRFEGASGSAEAMGTETDSLAVLTVSGSISTVGSLH